MTLALLSTSSLASFRLCNFDLPTLEERHTPQYLAKSYIRYGIIILILCITVTNGNLSPKQKILLAFGHAIIFPLCVVTGQHLEFSQVTLKNSGLTFLDLGVGLSCYAFFLHLFQFANDEFIREMSEKIDYQNQMKVILDNLEESIIIYSYSKIKYANDRFIDNFQDSIDKFNF
jgi:hypothetical protein